jgi:DNA polymerase-3 subunit delta
MIYLLYGPNTYEMDRGLGALLAGLLKKYPDVTPERLDASTVDPQQLPDILQGTSLFNEHRVVVLRQPSAHKALWTALETYADKLTDTTDLIIVDSGVDKRTKTFKALQKVAQAKDYPEFGPRNQIALQAWLIDEAKRQGLVLPRASAGLLIDRVGYDQWSLANAVTKLVLVEDASPKRIRELIELSPSANAFEIFEAALRGDSDRVRSMLADLQLTGDPHALVGLLAAQCYQLALVAYSSKTPVELGKLTGSSPYPLQKLTPVVRSLTKARVNAAIEAVAECDRDLKRSVAAPWTLITRALLKISTN